MPPKTIRVILGLCAASAGVLICAALAVMVYVFAAGDYVVRPGSPVYYFGISSVVRSIHVPDGASDREYYGSVGDGNKPAQSQVSFKISPAKADQAWEEMTRQLQTLGSRQGTLRPQPSTASSNKSVVSPGTREAEYTASHDLLLLSTYDESDASKAWVRFELTHFD